MSDYSHLIDDDEEANGLCKECFNFEFNLKKFISYQNVNDRLAAAAMCKLIIEICQGQEDCLGAFEQIINVFKKNMPKEN